MELVDEEIAVGALTLRIRRPPNPADLIDEARFDEDEYMPYWAELWPAGIALARAVADRDLSGRRVLELGCGLGLPSLAAARAGARVLATDWAPEALERLRENAGANDARLETLVADWRGGAQLVARGPWDLVLAADVLYERRNVEPLARLLPRLLADDGAALVADPGRPCLPEFEQLVPLRLEKHNPDAEHPRLALLELRA